MQQQTITGERIGTFFAILYNCDIITRGTQREDSSKPLKRSIFKRILVFKR